ncbi:PREDICTED: uncharacterized protein CXorf65 homolog [Nicrophorus vespilloides]|uniref:Uncharacterized protein CXorf65 homolog n=1 Tax=Nicrophorus vespilloides TaxID=110193 RepID=A0ABM1M4B7_NICVS|nr:PREDICTED: uncharacterized protein CXorf65 homolog [Nicrophorus vespilloides]
MFCFIKFSTSPDYNVSNVDISVSRAAFSVQKVPDYRESRLTYSMPGKNRLLMVNPDCYIQILLNYIYEETKLDANVLFDLCDENGELLGVHDLQPYESATKVLKNKQIYMIVIYEKDENNFFVKLEPMLNKITKQDSEFFMRLFRNVSHRKLVEKSMRGVKW